MLDLSAHSLATLAAWCADGRLDEAALDAEWSRRHTARSRPSPARRSRPPTPARTSRRRAVAAAGWLPPRLASHFTTAQVAALAVVAREVVALGSCTLCLDALADLAGCSRSSVRSAIRAALALGILSRRLRPRRGAKSETNVLEIISGEWSAWLRIGRKNVTPSNHSYIQNGVRALDGADQMTRRGLSPGRMAIGEEREANRGDRLKAHNHASKKP